MKRPITFAPSYGITKDGKLWHNNRPVPPSNHKAKFGLQHLVVWIGETRHYVWRLLTEHWYENTWILPRDGNLLDWRSENTFQLKQLTLSSITERRDPELVFFIWQTYQRDLVPCWNMAEKTGLVSHSVDEYRILVKDILVASVR